MKSAILALSLLATSALAAPGTAHRRARHDRRMASGRRSQPIIRSNTTAPKFGPDAQSNVQYSTNWAGAALVGSGYTGVTGTFTVPNPQSPDGDDGNSYSASAWVGLDGYTCETAILQTGVDFTVQDGEVSYDAWYEWYPDYAYDFSGIDFSAGDVVTVTVKATSKTGGTATIQNQSSGQKVSHTFRNQRSGSLCETNAEWIVEDFEEGDSLVPLVNFGTVVFTNAYATTSSGTVGVSGAQIVDMSTSGGSSGIEATASVSGNSEVVVKYV
ncbi:hypothetical protein ANO11243_018550 [Dothideomycetidae sp. 11243]|nr:hypothetical protein ANO11243_018550 [fungal sp. No.11243]